MPRSRGRGFSGQHLPGPSVITQNPAFLSSSWAWSMPPLLKNDSKSEPLLRVGWAWKSRCERREGMTLLPLLKWDQAGFPAVLRLQSPACLLCVAQGDTRVPG